jgi:hypothetical protein
MPLIRTEALLSAALDVLRDSTETRPMRAAALAWYVGPKPKRIDFRTAASSIEAEDVALELWSEFDGVLVNSAESPGGKVWVVGGERARELEDKLRQRLRRSTKVWLIHGGASDLWERIGNDLRGQAGLTCVEFSDLDATETTVTDRVRNMARECRLAVAVMSAEDTVEGGRRRARQNVIHETGLAQGTLGFDRVIVVLEAGVEPFSNFQGVIYLPLPSTGNADVQAMLGRLRDMIDVRLTL